MNLKRHADLTQERDAEVAEFGSFYLAEFPSVFKATYAFIGDREAAWDAAQEAFSRAFARWRRLRKAPWAGGWVMTTAMNVCRKEMRRRNRRFSLEDVPPETKEDDADENVTLIEAVRRLPARQRQAVILTYFGDAPLGAVAQAMELSEGTVKAHLFRARNALRAALSRDELAPEGSNDAT